MGGVCKIEEDGTGWLTDEWILMRWWPLVCFNELYFSSVKNLIAYFPFVPLHKIRALTFFSVTVFLRCHFRVSPKIPSSRDVDPLVEIDRNVRKLEIFLANSNPPLTVADLRRYLPCTVNVDPYLRKLIRGVNHSLIRPYWLLCLLVCALFGLLLCYLVCQQLACDDNVWLCFGDFACSARSLFAGLFYSYCCCNQIVLCT